MSNLQPPPNFSGLITFHQGNDLVESSTHGFRNLGESLPVTNHTRFGIASGAKGFTAVGILKLVQDELLSLNTSVDPFFSDYSLDTRITVLHLLTHTSGIPDYFDEEVMDDYEQLWEQIPNYRVRQSSDFLPLFAGRPQVFAPVNLSCFPSQDSDSQNGNQHECQPVQHRQQNLPELHYSNSAFILLARIIELVTRQDFPGYIQNNVFNKIGMDSSGYYGFDTLPADTALGYVYDEQRACYRSNIYSLPIFGGGDGGVYATADDMARFWSGLFEGKLLADGLVRAMTTPHSREPGGDAYGLGLWNLAQIPEVWFLQGADPGVVFYSFHHPGQNRTITFFGNQEGDWLYSQVDGLLGEWFR